MNVKGQAAEAILAQLGPGREQGEKTVMSLKTFIMVMIRVGVGVRGTPPGWHTSSNNAKSSSTKPHLLLLTFHFE